MSGVNPQGCQVFSFKAPTSEELDHDYLWRCAKNLPERGRIGIFNRSYYEEVLVVKVHPEFLTQQKLPPQLVGKDIWDNRYQDIRAFERYLSRNGVLIRKFFLHVSRDEQKRRFMERIDEPEKNWKFSATDVKERGHWNDYMNAYQTMIRETSTPDSPWYVVPADNKWYTRLVVARGHRRRAGVARPPLSESGQGQAHRTRRRQEAAARRVGALEGRPAAATAPSRRRIGPVSPAPASCRREAAVAAAGRAAPRAASTWRSGAGRAQAATAINRLRCRRASWCSTTLSGMFRRSSVCIPASHSSAVCAVPPPWFSSGWNTIRVTGISFVPYRHK